MFGYVKPHNPELRMRDYECYRAYYCGLCRAMGKCTGQCSRMTLSYDFVFLAAVRCHLTGEQPNLQKRRCLIHPLRPRTTVVGSAQLDYCANASAILAYQKCKDDRLDEGGLKKLRAGAAMRFLSSAYRKAKRRYPDLDRSVEAALHRLHEYERSATSPSADVPAEIFGELMSAVCAEGLEGTSARLAARIGQTVGRWIYLVDAADDLTEDRKKDRFNPYRDIFPDPPTPQDADTLRIALKAILQETEQAYLLMDEPPCSELGEILSNILYLGLPKCADHVLEHGFLGLKTKHKTKKENTHE